jgi:hypothetical protein
VWVAYRIHVRLSRRNTRGRKKAGSAAAPGEVKRNDARIRRI